MGSIILFYIKCMYTLLIEFHRDPVKILEIIISPVKYSASPSHHVGFELTSLISHNCVHLLLRCARRYENHLNRCHQCSSAISPCGRFIASGSEDNCVSCITLGFHAVCASFSPIYTSLVILYSRLNKTECGDKSIKEAVHQSHMYTVFGFMNSEQW